MSLLGTTRTNQDVVNAILNMAQKERQIVHGARATNVQLPPHLRRQTKDYDVYTKNPESAANRLAEKLNKQFGNGFKVVAGAHKGTFKVKDKSGETVVDYTQVTKRPSSKVVLGVQYASKGYAKRKIQGLIRDESKAFRREKDIETLAKLKAAEMSVF